MTKHRDLKAQVRARAEKTGESYTTAKKNLLEGKQPQELNALELGAALRDRESKLREAGCMCHLEEGDSPCPVHGDVEVARDDLKAVGLHRTVPFAVWLRAQWKRTDVVGMFAADFVNLTGEQSGLSLADGPRRPRYGPSAVLDAMLQKQNPERDQERHDEIFSVWSSALVEYGPDGTDCPTEHGACVLLKGHRSDEHGDDHQHPDGGWWNVGQVIEKPALVNVPGFQNPVPREVADAIEVLRRTAREDGAVRDAMFEAIFNESATNPMAPELLWSGVGSNQALFMTAFDRQVMRMTLEFGLSRDVAMRGPSPSDLWNRKVEQTDEDKAQLKALEAAGPVCSCGPMLGSNADCLFHHPPIVDPSASIALPFAEVDVAKKLMTQALADRGNHVSTVVTVDTSGMTPEQATEVVAGMKTRFGEELRKKARCTNPECGKVYTLHLTKSRVCEHCGHTPVEVLDPNARVFKTRAGWLTAKEPTAAELFSDDPNHEEDTACSCGGVKRIGPPVLGDDEDKIQHDDPDCLFHHPYTSRDSILAAFIDDEPDEIAMLPPVPVKDLVPMLEALKYINSGDAHADEVRAEASEILEEFDKKRPDVLTALHDPRTEEDFDPEELTPAIVNGKPCELPREVGYRKVLMAAGFDPERLLTVTYRAPGRPGGVMRPVQRVLVTPGMVFNVADTSSA